MAGRALIDGQSTGLWAKAGASIAHAAAALQSSGSVAAPLNGVQPTAVQKLARTLASSPTLRHGTRNRSRRIFW
jgi:hypothetical protein